MNQETQPSPAGQDWEALHEQGEKLLESGRLEEAIGCFQQALQAEERAQTHNRLGVALARLGRTSEALTAFQRAVALDPDQASAWTNLGNAYQELGDLTAARESYAKALALDPEYPLAHHNLGALLRREGKYDEAVRHLKQANRLERQRLKEQVRQKGGTARNQLFLLILLVLLFLILLRSR